MVLRGSGRHSSCSGDLCLLYGSHLQGQCWQLGIDYINVHAWLSKGTVKGEVCYELALQYLLQLFTLQVQLDFRPQPFWISSSTKCPGRRSVSSGMGRFSLGAAGVAAAAGPLPIAPSGVPAAVVAGFLWRCRVVEGGGGLGMCLRRVPFAVALCFPHAIVVLQL
ncbi:hypothetical protein COO60DRAFT_1551907 [Scenedesmus sp. NREL 46B-D3]|nr:hypothetical protein COO60DRAFT_1551907 [Scenedesmus sp. NREL 46B-D3]